MFDVITIGTATRDVFLKSPSFKVLRDKEHLQRIGFKTGEAECFALGSKIEVKDPVFAFGGGALNASVTFSRQGLRCASVLKVGDDESGISILSHLRSEKVKTFASIDKKNGTAYSTVLLTPGGERTILVYRGASETFSYGDFPARRIKTLWAYISPGDMPFLVINKIASFLKKNGVKIAFNPSAAYLDLKKNGIRKLFSFLDVVLVNREEASYLTGVPYDDERKIFKRFDELIEGIAVVTDGRNGALVSDGTYIYRAGIFREKKKVDRTGAGDAFGSGFIAGLIKKNDIHYALRLAAANSTSVVEYVGANVGVLTEKEFRNRRWKFLNLDVEELPI